MDQLIKQGIYKLTLYIPGEYEDLTRAFVELCKGTEKSASQRIVGFIQTELENIELEKKNVKLMCELCRKEFVSGALVKYVSGVRCLSCEACLKDRYDKGLVRTILKEFH